jgi:hypothetical protein
MKSTQATHTHARARTHTHTGRERERERNHLQNGEAEAGREPQLYVCQGKRGGLGEVRVHATPEATLCKLNITNYRGEMGLRNSLP